MPEKKWLYAAAGLAVGAFVLPRVRVWLAARGN